LADYPALFRRRAVVLAQQKEDRKMPANSGEFANTSEIAKEDAASIESPTDRRDHLGMPEAGDLVAAEIDKPIGARPKSAETGRHEAGSGANETMDGLDSIAEATRRGAEELTDVGESEDVPVFDRGRMI
jgi:hypothetical protein